MIQLLFLLPNIFYKLQDFQNIEINHRVDIDRIENSRQAGKNWGCVCTFSLYLPIFQIIYVVLMCTPAKCLLKMLSKYMPNSNFKTSFSFDV